MESEFDRLKRALAPEIALERKLQSGGMGTVWLGREVGLDRLVAIKTLNPDQFTAQAAARFVDEARLASHLFHPNIVRVHRAGDVAGIQFFVMDYMDGDTLQARLAEGALSPEQVLGLGHDLLAALAVAHRARIIHRDVKPANIFLQDGRALLGDFGIAKALDRKSDRATTGGPIGTPRYMPPEQWGLSKASERSDLYSVGVVLWEACTGRPWEHLAPAEVDWSDVPPSLRPALSRALQPNPADRWPNVAAFAAALPPATGRGAAPEDGSAPAVASDRVARRWQVVLPTALLCAGLVTWIWWRRHESSPPPSARPQSATMVVFPFAQTGSLRPALGRELAGRAGWYLDRLPRLTRVSSDAAARAWQSSDLPVSGRLAAVTADPLHGDYGIWGLVQSKGSELEVDLHAFDVPQGTARDFVVVGDSADLDDLGDRIGLAVVQNLLPDTLAVYHASQARHTANPEAAAEFFQGEDASSRGAWVTAEQHYLNALRADSSFVEAKWRLGMVRRWSLSPETFPAGFYPLDSAERLALSPAERTLVDAQFAPSAVRRLELYQGAVDSAPSDAYAALLYGDELFHRGPLVGRPLDSAVVMLRRAVKSDPSLAPAWEHLAWALIRLGRRDEASRALDALESVSGRPEESRIYLPPLLRAAYTLRFAPPQAGATPGAFGSLGALALAARGALAFDMPDQELAFGRRLAEVSEPRSPQRPSGLVAEGVALMALGRPAAAFSRFDSAAALFAAPEEAALQAAEWRVLPAALGMPGVSGVDVAQGRARLRTIAAGSSGSMAARAAWALGVDAFARGDGAAGRNWRARLRELGARDGPLDLLLAGIEKHARGDRSGALALTAPVLAFDSAGTRMDPFLRSAAHMLRGEWLAAEGATDRADRAWLWYENTDVVGWPSTEAQPAEVDWALGPSAGARRAALAFRRGDRPAGCVLALRTLRFWAEPEPAAAAASAALRRLAEGCAA